MLGLPSASSAAATQPRSAGRVGPVADSARSRCRVGTNVANGPSRRTMISSVSSSGLYGSSPMVAAASADLAFRPRRRLYSLPVSQKLFCLWVARWIPFSHAFGDGVYDCPEALLDLRERRSDLGIGHKADGIRRIRVWRIPARSGGQSRLRPYTVSGLGEQIRSGPRADCAAGPTAEEWRPQRAPASPEPIVGTASQRRDHQFWMTHVAIGSAESYTPSRRLPDRSPTQSVRHTFPTAPDAWISILRPRRSQEVIPDPWLILPLQVEL